MRLLAFILAGSAMAAPPSLFGESKRPIPVQPPVPGVAGHSARACAGCHAEIFEQWRQSMHSAAWNDPQFQELWRSRSRERACLSCHSPLLAQHRQVGGKPNPAFEPTLQSEGVTCAACHVRDGKIVGAGTSTTTAPHPVDVRPELSTPKLCGHCHQLPVKGQAKGTYDTLAEFARTPHAQAGGTCADCHMPKVNGNVAVGVHRPYFSHDFAGAHDDAMLQRALTVTVKLDKPMHGPGELLKASVEVRNTGAAHAVPSGDPAHQVRVLVGLADSQGEFLEKSETLLARKASRDPPYRERVDTRLMAGKSRTIRFESPVPNAIGEHYLIVQLSYHLMPPEQAEQLGIPDSVTSRVFDTQIVPVGSW